MAELIKKTFLNFKKSGSQDVAGYVLYVQEMPDPVTRTSERVDLGNPADDGNGNVAVDISSLSEMTTKDGRYNLGLASVDDAGNESSLLTEGLQDVALDFAAPDPPTNASVSYV
jgi:hypothetical protein